MVVTEIDIKSEPLLNIDEIQGNILAGFNKDFQILLFLKITQIDGAKKWLCSIEPHIATLAEVIQFNKLFKTTRKRRGGREGTVRSTFINIGFSFDGLKKLTNEAEQFTDKAFKEGLYKRSALLGDPTNEKAEGHPSNWVIGGKNNLPDIILIVASDDKDRLDEEVAWIESNLDKGLQVIYKQQGATLLGELRGHEHFGFKDGVSQPGVRGRLSEDSQDLLTPRENPNNREQGKPGQDILWPGEFVFNYPTQIATPVPGQEGLNINPGTPSVAGPEWAKDGSFLVFRRLRQDVKGFHDFVKAESSKLAKNNPDFTGITFEKLGAKFVGRWASGAPILRATTTDTPGMGDDECANNYFEFEGDSDPLTSGTAEQCKDNFAAQLSKNDDKGLVCPFAGHIRKAYPRDTEREPMQLGEITIHTNESDTQTHRLLRRGIPFGKPFQEDSGNNQPTYGEESFIESLLDKILSLFGLKEKEKPQPQEDESRGLLFLAYQTSIERQFEFVTRAWVNNPDFPGTKDGHNQSGHDPIIGQNNLDTNRVRTCVLQSTANNASIKLPVDWVIPTGGGYFFTPSISALKYLASSK